MSETIRGGGTTVRVVNPKLKGVPWATIATAPEKTDLGASQVQIIVSALDHHDMASVAVSMTMSSAKARELAAQLVRSADKADAL